jgi:hypothetical protein
MVFNIVIIILLSVIIIIQLIGKNRLNIDLIISLFERNGKEQLTEQFKCFNLINDSINSTLQNSRTETNEQLGKYAGVDGKIAIS